MPGIGSTTSALIIATFGGCGLLWQCGPPAEKFAEVFKTSFAPTLPTAGPSAQQLAPSIRFNVSPLSPEHADSAQVTTQSDLSWPIFTETSVATLRKEEVAVILDALLLGLQPAYTEDSQSINLRLSPVDNSMAVQLWSCEPFCLGVAQPTTMVEDAAVAKVPTLMHVKVIDSFNGPAPIADAKLEEELDKVEPLPPVQAEVTSVVIQAMQAEVMMPISNSPMEEELDDVEPLPVMQAEVDEVSVARERNDVESPSVATISSMTADMPESSWAGSPALVASVMGLGLLFDIILALVAAAGCFAFRRSRQATPGTDGPQALQPTINVEPFMPMAPVFSQPRHPVSDEVPAPPSFEDVALVQTTKSTTTAPTTATAETTKTATTTATTTTTTKVEDVDVASPRTVQLQSKIKDIASAAKSRAQTPVKDVRDLLLQSKINDIVCAAKCKTPVKVAAQCQVDDDELQFQINSIVTAAKSKAETPLKKAISALHFRGDDELKAEINAIVAARKSQVEASAEAQRQADLELRAKINAIVAASKARVAEEKAEEPAECNVDLELQSQLNGIVQYHAECKKYNDELLVQAVAADAISAARQRKQQVEQFDEPRSSSKQLASPSPAKSMSNIELQYHAHAVLSAAKERNTPAKSPQASFELEPSYITPMWDAYEEIDTTSSVQKNLRSLFDEDDASEAVVQESKEMPAPAVPEISAKPVSKVPELSEELIASPKEDAPEFDVTKIPSPLRKRASKAQVPKVEPDDAVAQSEKCTVDVAQEGSERKTGSRPKRFDDPATLRKLKIAGTPQKGTPSREQLAARKAAAFDAWGVPSPDVTYQ